MSRIGNPEVMTFEPQDEREELLVAFAEEVAEHGFAATTVEALIARADVDRATFDRYFADLPDCVAQALDVLTERCFSALAAGFLSTPGTWADAAYGAFEAFFRFCVGSPAFMYALVVELPYGGEAALRRRTETHALFADFIRPALAEMDPNRRPAGDETLYAQMICGGIFEVFRTYAEDDRIPELLDALPWVAYAGLAPLVGRDEARRVVAQGRARAVAN
jgi:AcrR family transcriptional regulator